MRKSRWAYLLEEDDVFRRWYNNLAMGSEVTAKERARVLYRFVVKLELTVDGIVEMGKRDVGKVEDLLMDFVSELHKEGKSPGYIENYLKSVKSWLEFNGVQLVRKIKIGNRGATPTLEDERVPTPDELFQVLGYAGIRGRCSISLMAFSGLRPEVLGNVNGSDGLELRDLPEISVEGGRVSFLRVPMLVRVRASLSKAKHKYFTFIGAEGCDYLKAYLEQRLAQGEELNGKSAVIAVKRGHESRGFRNGDGVGRMHIATKTATKEIRDAMRPRFMWRPYVLRSYFATRLLVAESNGKMTHSYRQFHMGHSGDMLARYTVNKGELPEELIEDMRRSFATSEEYLSTRRASGEDPEMTTIRTMVESGVLDIHKPNVRDYLISKLGIEDAKQRVAMMVSEAGIKEDEAMATVIIGALGLTESNITRELRVKNTTKIVNENELPEYLTDGWKIDTPLPSGNIVIKKFTYY